MMVLETGGKGLGVGGGGGECISHFKWSGGLFGFNSILLTLSFV